MSVIVDDLTGLTGNYRCPNCAKRDLPGTRFLVEIYKIDIMHQMAFLTIPEGDTVYVYCQKCLLDGIPGLDYKPGLVLRREEWGDEWLTAEKLSK